MFGFLVPQFEGVDKEKWYSLQKRIKQMSDMLQLVVNRDMLNCFRYLKRKKLKLPQLDDKLKHVGHLLDAFL